jgi:hypothetical protein
MIESYQRLRVKSLKENYYYILDDTWVCTYLSNPNVLISYQNEGLTYLVSPTMRPGISLTSDCLQAKNPA